MRHLFDPLLWPLVLTKKCKALIVWVKDNFKPRRYRSRIAYWGWLLTRRKGKSFSKFLFQWKKPKILHFPFLIYLLKSKQKPLSFKIFLFGIPTILFLLFGSLFGYPLLKKYKAQKFAKTAVSALENKDYNTALLTAQSAHLMQSDNVETLRSLVKSSQALMHPRYLEWSLKLANHPKASREDKLNYLRACVSMGQNRIATKWLNQQKWNESSLEELIYLRCILLSRVDEEGKFQAFELAKNSLDQFPQSLRLSSFLWDMCLNSGQVYLVEEGISHLKKSANSQEKKIMRAAIRRILKAQLGSVEDLKVLAKKLWKHENLTIEETILAMNAVYSDTHLSLENLMFLLDKEFENINEPQTRIEIINLLNQIGRKDLARDLMNQEAANKSTGQNEILEKILSGMQLEDKVSVRNLLYDSETILSHQVRRFLNYMFKRKTNTPINDDEMDQILATARNQDLEIMQRFLFLFKDAKCIIRFVEELEKRSQNHAGIKYILATCYRRLNRGDDLENTLVRTRMPEKVSNFSGELQTCMLKSLYGQDLNRCRKWAEDAVGQHPSNLSARYALALCYLKKQELVNALSTIGPLLKGSPPLCPTQRLIGAAVLNETNGHELAKKWLPSEHKSLLIGPEKDLFNKILREIELVNLETDR